MARTRGNTTARGYGHTHQQQRRAWAPIVATGAVTCPRCGKPITPGQGFDLGHTEDRTGYTGP